MLNGSFSQKDRKNTYVGRDKVIFTEARAINKATLQKTVSGIFHGIESFSGQVIGNHLSVQTGFRRWLNELIDNLQSIDDSEARTNALDIIIPVAETERYKTKLEWSAPPGGDFPLPRKTVPFRRLPHADDSPPELRDYAQAFYLFPESPKMARLLSSQETVQKIIQNKPLTKPSRI